MKKHTLLGTILSAALITAGGLAMAQQSPGAGPASPAMPSGPSSGMAGSSMMAPSQEVVGRNVVNAQGEEIGEISAVMGNRVIVEVGGFLGIGAREVALDWDKITPTGMGDDMKLQTTLTKKELEAMPEYKK